MPMPKQIFLIEDDEVISSLLKEILEGASYHVVTATDGQDALAQLEARQADPPALILLDLMMPKMDGFQFMSALSLHEAFKDIPIIAMSADSQIKQKLHNTMASTYVKKPLKISALLEVVREYSM